MDPLHNLQQPEGHLLAWMLVTAICIALVSGRLGRHGPGPGGAPVDQVLVREFRLPRTEIP